MTGTTDTVAPDVSWAGDPMDALPVDHREAVLVGRVWEPEVGGPTPVVLRDGELIDISRSFPTIRDLCETDDPAREAVSADGPSLGAVERVLHDTMAEPRDASTATLLAPVDLQALKAAGVTFAASMIERLIEERAAGDQMEAARIRELLTSYGIATDLKDLEPGSQEAERLKESLIAAGLWSQYLEVGIGPDAEIFTKGQVLSAIGTGVPVGVRRDSTWNNPEPEVALIVQSSGRTVGATLANDVNLRDLEGRSALLLSTAKDNNASCAIGPFIRLFDDRFTFDDVSTLTITLNVAGEDGFELAACCEMGQISRPPKVLVQQMMSHHDYPDGAVLLLGTGFAPVQDRGEEGSGFTHQRRDIVRIATPKLGALVNRVLNSDECEPWTYGVGDLMRNLSARGLL